MSKVQMLLFCVAALLASAGLAAVLFPHAALPDGSLASAQTPLPMEDIPDIDLGADFGSVPVTELMGYYLENPPEVSNTEAPEPEKQFGGC